MTRNALYVQYFVCFCSYCLILEYDKFHSVLHFYLSLASPYSIQCTTLSICPVRRFPLRYSAVRHFPVLLFLSPSSRHIGGDLSSGSSTCRTAEPLHRRLLTLRYSCCPISEGFEACRSGMARHALLVMVAVWNRADHHIFMLWFVLLLLLLSFFPRLISAATDWMSAILHTWCGLSANLSCRSETCCTRLGENTGRKKVAKNRHLGTIAQVCWAISSQRRHKSTIGKKTY